MKIFGTTSPGTTSPGTSTPGTRVQGAALLLAGVCALGLAGCSDDQDTPTVGDGMSASESGADQSSPGADQSAPAAGASPTAGVPPSKGVPVLGPAGPEKGAKLDRALFTRACGQTQDLLTQLEEGLPAETIARVRDEASTSFEEVALMSEDPTVIGQANDLNDALTEAGKTDEVAAYQEALIPLYQDICVDVYGTEPVTLTP